MSEPESRASSAYYLLPILLGILGGVIGYFVLRNRDAKKARNCLLVGIGITAVGTAGLIAMGSTGGPEFDRPLTEMPDSVPAQTEDFVDSTGYMPAWAAGKGQHQISSVCLNVNTMDDIDTPDWNWCNEYFGYLLDSGSARDSGFVDSAGYTPDWAAGKGDNQISSICSNINTMDDIDTPDWRWCNEFVGYLLDATGPAQDSGFVDSAGYTPDWAAGKGDNQISSICSNINTMENIDTPDWRWCNEFVGYLLDTMSSPGTGRMPAGDEMPGSTSTHAEPADPMPAQAEGFADSTGYMPDWAAGKDKTQISSICIDESIFEDIRDPDWNWCSEFFGYLLDAGSTRNSDFVDSTGHAPVWTAGRGENQMTAICTNKSTMEDTGTPDWRWCKEFLGYLLDSTGPVQDRFVDSTGYTPDWAAGKGKNQMISACTDRNTIENINTPDWNWCKEFFGYLIGDSPEGLALSDAITAPTTLESVSLDAVISEPEHAGTDDLANFYIMRTKELIAIKNRDLAECLAVDTNDLDSAGRYIERTLDSSINALAAISHISSKSQSHNLIPAVFPHFTEYKEVQTLATDCLFEKKDEAERIHGFETVQEKISQSQAERNWEAGLESGHADPISVQAEGFADSAGYTPDWVAGKDRDQMTSICTDDDTMEGADTSDWDWCKEFFGHLLDATGPAQEGFVDSAGYTPDWAADKGENQISSICSKKNTMENIGTPDWVWCDEFFGYLLDSSPEGLALSDAITAPASLGLVTPETVIQEPEHAGADELADYYIMRIKELAAIKNRDLAECFMVDANDLDSTSEYVENSAVSSVNSLLVSSHILSRALSHGLSDTIFPYFMEQSEVLGRVGDCSDVKEGEADQIHGSGAVQEKISQNQAERDLEAGPEPEESVDLNDIYISKMREATGLIMETYEECLRVDTDDLDSVNRWINNVLEKTEASGLLLDEIGPSVESDPRFIPAQTELFEAIEKAEECGQAVFAELDP